ncbi:MAG: aminocarboxymuconate-semialdehyde decarboxylase [Actinomycetota bacterium]|jgi:aminocarboxymuconate-semialdehyde decarboxylase|nr:aminocarboxymuconate-semialdehyde decarboxylase [Actinomycetota bacterium]
MKVDVHAHVLSSDLLGKAGKYGPELTDNEDGSWSLRVGQYSTRSAPGGKGIAGGKDLLAKVGNPDLRVREMDEKGIDMMGVTISPLFYLYWAEAEIAIPFATAQNDFLLWYAEQHPTRFFANATLPLQDVDAAIEELERTVARGAKGVNIGTDNIAGRNLDSEALWPLYRKIEELDVPIFLHPYPAPIEGGVEDRYNLSWIVGYTTQETTAFAHLTLGGVLDDFPNLNIYITHGGGAVPYQFGRLELAQDRMPDVRAKKPLPHYLKNFYFDCLLHDVRARRFLVEFMGADHLIIGDNYGGWDALNGFTLLDELDLSDEDRRKIEGENARRIFHL